MLLITHIKNYIISTYLSAKLKVTNEVRMRHLYVFLIFAPLLPGCNYSSEDKALPANNYQPMQSLCMKTIKVRGQDKKLVAGDAILENETVLQARKDKLPDEQVLEVSIRIYDDEHANRDINCTLSDGKRDYAGHNRIKANTTYTANNLCDVIFDLDSPTFGTFTMEYSQGGGNISYYDEDGSYQFQIPFRTRECIELN